MTTSQPIPPPDQEALTNWVVNLALTYPLTHRNIHIITNALAQKTIELTRPNLEAWCFHYMQTQPQWSTEQIQSASARQVVPLIHQVDLTLNTLLLVVWQHIGDTPVYDTYTQFLTEEATEYQHKRHQHDVSRGIEGLLTLNDHLSRCIELVALLRRERHDERAFDLGLRNLIEPITIKFYPANPAHREAKKRLHMRAYDLGIETDEALRRLKMSAACAVLAGFDRPYKKKFGNGVGDVEHIVTPDGLYFRDLIKLFDDEVREACLADLLENHYPNPSTEDLKYTPPAPKKKAQGKRSKRGRKARPQIESLDEQAEPCLKDVTLNAADLDEQGDADLDSPVALVAANDEHADAREELSLLIERSNLHQCDRELLDAYLDWLKQDPCRKPNLSRFCQDTRRNYGATKKQYQKICNNLLAS